MTSLQPHNVALPHDKSQDVSGALVSSAESPILLLNSFDAFWTLSILILGPHSHEHTNNASSSTVCSRNFSILPLELFDSLICVFNPIHDCVSILPLRSQCILKPVYCILVASRPLGSGSIPCVSSNGLIGYRPSWSKGFHQLRNSYSRLGVTCEKTSWNPFISGPRCNDEFRSDAGGYWSKRPD